METDRILFLATAEAYELINAPETDEGVKYVLEHAFNLYKNAKRGVKGSGLTSGHLPLSIHTRWAEMAYDKDLILICNGACSSIMMGLVWNGRDVLADALDTALPVLSH